MSGERWIEVVGVAVVVTAALVPLCIRFANRMGLLDRPSGWKEHVRATPYLGGAAVIAGVMASGLLFAGEIGRLASIFWITPLLLLVGLIDDGFTLPATPRLAIEFGAGAVLWESGLGWELHAADWVNLLLTMFWVASVINAVNLLDLMDGVATSVAAAAAAGFAALAASNGDQAVLVVAVATSASCVAFLPFNLAGPARIFLGDAGTMPLGFLLAALATAAFSDQEGSASSLVIAACLLGVPLFDMAVRIVLRRSRGVALLTAGPDSLANRLHDVVGSPRVVAVSFGTAQLALSAVAVGLADSEAVAAVGLFAVALLGGIAAAVTLHRPGRATRPQLAAPGD